MIPDECRRARSHFPDLMDPPADAAAARHLDACAACREELEVFRAIVQEASRLGKDEVPDPGSGYWDGFLPSVRARIGQDRVDKSRSHLRLGLVAAAAVVMLAAGLMLSALSPTGTGSGSESQARLDSYFADMDSLSSEQVQALALQEWDLAGSYDAEVLAQDAGDLDLEEVIDTIDAMDEPETLYELLRDLDDDQLDQLRRQIKEEGTIQLTG